MKLHKLKYENGSLETIVLLSAELIENMMKLKFGKVAKSLFAIRKNELSLIEAEIKAPGKELAYLYKAKQMLA